jgi:hypothetical protein
LFARQAAVVGASGAVYGVLLAYAMFWPRAQMIVFPIPVPVEARFVIGAYLVLSIVQGVGGLSSGVAHFAHLGGAAFGFAFLRWWEWRKGSARRDFQRKMTVDVSASGIVGDKVALARWKGISLEGMHELNRGEVQRLISKAERDGPASLSRTEREFLDRMSAR